MKTWIICGIVVAVVLGLVGWRIVDKQHQDSQLASSQKARNTAAPSVDVAVAGPQELNDVLESTGSVDSPYNVKLSPKLTGLITSLTARQGDGVKSGEPLVQIDPTEVNGQVLQARQALAEAKFRLAQAQITADPTNVGVKTTIKQSQAALNSAKADQNQTVNNYKAQIAAAQSLVTDADAKVAAAESQVDVANKNLTTAQATAKNAKAKYNREDSLYRQNFVAAQDVEDAKTAMEVADAAVGSSEAQVRAAQQGLNSAKAQRKSVLQNLTIVLNKGISDIADAKAHTDQSAAALELAQSNRAVTPAYRANLEALKAEVGVAEGNLRQALARQSDTTLRSPIDGTITDRGADPGTVVNPGTAVLTIQYLDWVFVTAGLPVDQAPKVRLGQEAEVTFDAFPGRVFQGKLSQVVQSADPASRQFSVQVKLLNPEHLIRPGMFGKVKVIVERHAAAITVPREAVTTDPKTNKSTVLVVDDQKVAHQTEVTLGRQNAKYIEILSGVKAGDTVVTLSYQPVKDGKKVKPNEPKPTEGPGKSPSVAAAEVKGATVAGGKS
jgi:RND family efflux transporter MFP subunit